MIHHFFRFKNYFQGFFLPDDYSLDITTLQQQQSQDPVLRTVYSWIIKNEKPETLTPLITGTPFLHAYYKRFAQLFIDDSTNLISFYTKHPTTLNQSSTPDFVHATIRICLPFRIFKTVYNKLHEHSHTGIKITYNTFAQYYYIPFVEKWLSIFIHDCIECQRNKHFNKKIQTAPTQSFSEHAPSFNYRISMETKGPNNPPSHNKSYKHVIIDAFSHFVVTVPIKSNNAKTAIKTLLHHWNFKFGPPIYLVTDQNVLIKKWHTFVHLWEFVILLKQLTLLGQMALSKYKTEILVHTYECSYMTHLKTEHSKSICTLMHIIHNHFQNSVFLPLKLFLHQTQNRPYVQFKS